MAERPTLYRVFRLGDAVTLGLAAAALAASTATAARTEVGRGFDPSATGKALAFQRPDGGAVLRSRGRLDNLPGRDPAIGGPYAAVITGTDVIQIMTRVGRNPIASVSAPNVKSLAISRGWLVYLTVDNGNYGLRARRLDRPSDPGKVKAIASAPRSVQLGHPSLDGGRLVYAVAKRHRNSIKRHNLGSSGSETVLRSRTDELLNPSVYANWLIYVRVDRARQGPQKTSPPKLRQRLMLRRLHGHGPGHKIYAHGRDRTMWSTSLSWRRGFVTLFRGGGPKIVSVHR
jgi:hypothetical protein